MAGKERPILFSAPMVRAILDGRKSQTRRAVKPAPVSASKAPLISFNHGVPEWSFGLGDRDARGLRWWRCPYGQIGDLLWVREAWQSDVEDGPVKPSLIREGSPIFYAAGGAKNAGTLAVSCAGWRPSIHMPRWASRITLRITDVRVERLNEISVSDCYAEGCFRPDPARCLGSAVTIRDNARGEYRRIWQDINGPGSWDANPWVWVVAFDREAA